MMVSDGNALELRQDRCNSRVMILLMHVTEWIHKGFVDCLQHICIKCHSRQILQVKVNGTTQITIACTFVAM